MQGTQAVKRVLVVGASGGSGRAAVEALLQAGHEVTAFQRTAMPGRARLRCVTGDVRVREDVLRAVQGQDAVVVTLGIRENPLRVRVLGAAGTAMDVRSEGTRNVVEAMRVHGVRRLVVQTSYGVGETRERLRAVDRMFFALLLAPQIADTERQEAVVRGSGLEWALVQPVHLTDGEDAGAPCVATDGRTERMQVSRRSVGQVLARAVVDPALVGQCVAVSGARAGAARAA